MWATITKPFAWLMVQLYNWTGSYGLSVILFALVVNLVLTPFMAKSKKSSMKMARFQPKIAELQKRHAGNQQKLNQEMQNLYREEGVNPMSGCLWSLIPFPILIALYSVIRQPLSRMMFVPSEAVEALQNFFVEKGWYAIPEKADAYFEIKLNNILHNNWGDVQSAIQSGVEGLKGFDFSRLINIDFTSLGINLGNQPNWRVWQLASLDDSHAITEGVLLFLIPFVSAGLSALSMKIAQKSTPQQDDQSAATMKSMNLVMPLMSIWFCFIMPAVMGVYWIANSVFGMVRDIILTKIIKAQMDKEDADKIAEEAERERKAEIGRLEMERRHAEGTTEFNENTSKKKQKAIEKQQNNERKAAIEREERAARRERLGIEDPVVPASQVGNRKYARGRAYDPDRFSKTEEPVAEQAAAEEVADDKEVVTGNND